MSKQKTNNPQAIKNQAKLQSKDVKLEKSAKPINQKLWLVIIVVLTIIAFTPIFKNKITNWDDEHYITKNPLIKELSIKNTVDIFTSENKYYMGNYHPLTMLSLALDYSINNNSVNASNPWMFHLTNLLLHVFNTILVFYIILLLFQKAKSTYAVQIALLTSLLFGVHTLHVESVAWLSERKDVLYSFFFFFSIFTYIKYLEKNKILFLITSFLLFILSLLSKGQAVSLAISLFAVDYYWDRKLLSIRVVAEKIPFLILAGLFGYVAIQAQKAGEAIHDMTEYHFYERILFAAYGFTQYIIKLILPTNLSALYPYLYVTEQVPAYYFLYVLFILMVIFAFVWSVRKSKPIAFAIAFFVINIALLLQLIPVGSAIFADRYAYIPSVGFFMLLAILYAYVLEGKKKLTIIANIIAIFYVTILIFFTFNRNQIWKDGITLWGDVTSKQPTAQVAWNNFGSANKEAGFLPEAIQNFDKAIDLSPKYYHAFYNRGAAKNDYGDTLQDVRLWESALVDYNKALEIKVDFAEAYHNRGITKDNLGDIKGAIDDFSQAIKLKLDDFKPFINRGVALGKTGKLTEAIADFDHALQMSPNNSDAYSNRGLALSHMQKYKEALIDFEKALAIKPNFADALYNRGLAKNALENYAAAIADYNLVESIKPKFIDNYFSRGISYYNLKKYDQALADFNKVIKYSPSYGNAYYYKGLIAYTLGNKSETCSNIQAAVKFGYTPVSPILLKYCNFVVVANK